jgi:hypothetical protein
VGQTIAFCRLSFFRADHEERWSAQPRIMYRPFAAKPRCAIRNPLNSCKLWHGHSCLYGLETDFSQLPGMSCVAGSSSGRGTESPPSIRHWRRWGTSASRASPRKADQLVSGRAHPKATLRDRKPDYLWGAKKLLSAPMTNYGAFQSPSSCRKQLSKARSNKSSTNRNGSLSKCIRSIACERISRGWQRRIAFLVFR